MSAGRFPDWPLQRGTGGGLLVSTSNEMSRVQKAAFVIVALWFPGIFLHELLPFHQHGHFAPLGLHADVTVATSNDVLGVEGTAKIYRARLTNYVLLPTTVLVS
jgi:hypothetical protein